VTTATAPYEVLVEDIRELTRTDWLGFRRLGLGSSDAAPCMGLSAYKSAYSTFCDKRALVPEMPDREDLYWGRAVEPLIIAKWQADTNTEYVQRHVMLRSTRYPFLQTNPDGLVPSEGLYLEAKFRHPADWPRWDIGVPDDVTLQVMHGLVVTGYRMGLVLALFHNRLAVFEIPYDPEVAEPLVESERLFWERVQNNDAPEPDHSEATTAALRERYYEVADGSCVNLPPEAAGWLETRQACLNLMIDPERSVKQIKNLFREALGDNEIGLIDGEPVVSWKARKDGVRVLTFT